jgi:hypothetical protein
MSIKSRLENLERRLKPRPILLGVVISNRDGSYEVEDRRFPSLLAAARAGLIPRAGVVVLPEKIMPEIGIEPP